MNDPIVPMSSPEDDPQRLTRFVEALFDALDKGENVTVGSLLESFFPELQTRSPILKQLNLDDSNHELD